MEQQEQIQNTPPFNEDEWLRLLFLLNDTQSWLNDLVTQAVLQTPMKEKRKLFRKAYCLTVPILVHIIERHYYKVLRHPEKGKFTISVVEILCYLRDASAEQTTPVPGSACFQRSIKAEKTIGFDRWRQPTSLITVITDGCGRIITAFPGNRVL